jgi:hypothetical protein
MKEGNFVLFCFALFVLFTLSDKVALVAGRGNSENLKIVSFFSHVME